ncbi:MAG: polyhydroxyalkanoate synthesis regulator DNA-binding domain-containing protein [Candidatus Zixiibacteriota bacterium]
MVRVIKRYSNRRLYDTESSRTLTQRELASLIKAGEQVRIIDSTSSADITLDVLGRVMQSEANQWKNSATSKELFQNIIVLGGETTMSILRNTVLASIGVFQVTRSKAEKIIDDLIKRGDLDRSDRKKAVMELLDRAEKSTAGVREKIARETSKAQQNISKVVKDLKLAKGSDLKKVEKKIDRLAKSIKELEKKLSAM